MTTRNVGGTLAAVVLLGVLPACVREETDVPSYETARFNERIRGDLHPLTPADLGTDQRFGTFRDGAEGGVMSELVPLSGAGQGGPGHLVQTGCLFVGQELTVSQAVGSADQMRLNWEVAARVKREGTFGELLADGFNEVGLCTFSDPVTRLLFDGPGRAIRPAITECSTQDGPFAFTVSSSPDAVPVYCTPAHLLHEIKLEAFAPGPGEEPGADGVCPREPREPLAPCTDERSCPSVPMDPPGHFRGVASEIQKGSFAEGSFVDGFWSACGFRNGAQPSGDLTYRLSLKTDSVLPGPLERWLRPNVMVVKGDRTIARPLTLRDTVGGLGRYTWHTEVTPANGEGQKRWAENFTPTVVVRTAQLISRDAAGGNEAVERPDRDLLKIIVPQPRSTTTVVNCVGIGTGSDFRFPVGDCLPVPDTGSLDLRRLTPTYAASVLTDDVTRPVEWEVSLPQAFARSGRQAFIRFGLHASAAPAMMKISPARYDFGSLQVGRSSQGTFELQNTGGQTLEIQDVELRADCHSAPLPDSDFSILVAGDPVPMPLPIEAKPDGKGGAVLRMASNASEAPILHIEESGDSVQVSVGDAAYGTDPQPLTLYGQPARLVGGVLLRDDPAAIFRPGKNGDPRPIALDALTERKPPFQLASGQTVKVFATAHPLQSGDHRAMVHVGAAEVGRPTVTLSACGAIGVTALNGPQLDVAPMILGFGHMRARAMLVQNPGYFDLVVTRLQVIGRDAARFAIRAGTGGAPFTLPPNGFRDVWIDWTPRCDATLPLHEAAIAIESNGGRATIPLFGASSESCPH